MQGAENVWRYNVDNKLVKTIQPLEQAGYEDLRFNWNAPMAVSAHQPDRFYMGSQFLHKSEDMGDTWEIISPDLSTNDSTKQQQADSGGLSMDNSFPCISHILRFMKKLTPHIKTIWLMSTNSHWRIPIKT